MSLLSTAVARAFSSTCGFTTQSKNNTNNTNNNNNYNSSNSNNSDDSNTKRQTPIKISPAKPTRQSAAAERISPRRGRRSKRTSPQALRELARRCSVLCGEAEACAAELRSLLSWRHRRVARKKRTSNNNNNFNNNSNNSNNNSNNSNNSNSNNSNNIGRKFASSYTGSSLCSQGCDGELAAPDEAMVSDVCRARTLDFLLEAGFGLPINNNNNNNSNNDRQACLVLPISRSSGTQEQGQQEQQQQQQQNNNSDDSSNHDDKNSTNFNDRKDHANVIADSNFNGSNNFNDGRNDHCLFDGMNDDRHHCHHNDINNNDDNSNSKSNNNSSNKHDSSKTRHSPSARAAYTCNSTADADTIASNSRKVCNSRNIFSNNNNSNSSSSNSNSSNNSNNNNNRQAPASTSKHGSSCHDSSQLAGIEAAQRALLRAAKQAARRASAEAADGAKWLAVS
ncbi:unnamed protein product [Polarella glacialis]|uniref:Uncharacterized protein n=1 Tax=Polarella glacialis TaxID=89957 RepID=A0A813HJA2_POLGL|nr:unnamed protein product [Polarella glacialis]